MYLDYRGMLFWSGWVGQWILRFSLLALQADQSLRFALDENWLRWCRPAIKLL